MQSRVFPGLAAAVGSRPLSTSPSAPPAPAFGAGKQPASQNAPAKSPENGPRRAAINVCLTAGRISEACRSRRHPLRRLAYFLCQGMFIAIELAAAPQSGQKGPSGGPRPSETGGCLFGDPQL